MSRRPIRVLELRSVHGTGGGPEKTILQGARRADRNRVEVVVCYIRDARDTVFGIDQKAAGLGLDYVEIPERHSFDTSVWRALRELIQRRQIDIVHAHEYKTDLLAWLLSLREPILPLATAHGWTGHSPRERRVYYPIDKRVLARYPRLIAVSSQIRDELIGAGARPEVVTTVLNGIDATAFTRVAAERAGVRARYGIPEACLTIGAVGRLEPQKRFDVAIEAVSRLRDRHPQLRLLIAGEGSDRANLVAAVERHGMASACQLLGHVNDIAALHHAFDLFVQSSAYEGTPNAVLEAMALETPTVATEAGGTAEILRHEVDGLITPIGDVDALAAAIDRCLQDPAAVARRVASARARVETDLSFETRTRTLERIYEELFERGRRRPS